MKPRRHPLGVQMAAQYAAVTGLAGIVFVAVSFGIVERNTAGLTDALIGLGVITLAALGAGWGIARYALKPLRAVTAKAQQISATSLHQRIGLEGPDDELQQLATTIDALLARLEGSFERERRFVANASHEIRTPLAVTRTALELGLNASDATVEQLRQVIAQALGATARTETLAADLLLLAQSESAAVQRCDQFDLTELTREVLNDFISSATASDVDLHTDLSPTPMWGNAGLVDRLVVNLIDNAVRHNSQPGWIKVTTKATGNRAVLTVENLTVENPSGPADQESVDELFEPFHRGTASLAASGHGTPGHGLGLSIVRAIAISHGALWEARRIDNGHVFQVKICFAACASTNARPAGCSVVHNATHSPSL